MKDSNLRKIQTRLDKIRKFLSETTEPFDDWFYDGKELGIYLDGELIELYSNKDLKELI